MLDLIARLPGAKATGTNRWMAPCPGPNHNNGDRHPSLSVRLIEGDRWLLYCFAGCTAFDVCTALNLKFGDLFHDRIAKREYVNGKDHNGNPVPRIRASEFLEPAAHEAFVVALIAADIIAKKEIDQDTWKRLAAAYRRLSDARIEALGG
jgi:hypothetical protein